MNICFLSTCQFNEYAGGIDRVCCQLSREFIHRGYRLVFVYGNPSVLGSPAEGCDGDGQYQFPYRLWDDRNIDFFSDIVVKHNVNVVIDAAFISRYHDIAYHAKQKTPFKLITTYHGDPLCDLKEIQDKIDCLCLYHNGLKLIMHRILLYLKSPMSYYLRFRSLKSRMRKIIRESDYYVVLCEDYAKRIRRISGCSKSDHIVSINNPIVQNNVSIRNCSKKDQVLFVGRLNEQKRVDRLLRIWKVVEQKSDNWELIVIGDGDARDKYEKYAHNLQLKNVRFIGNVNSSEEMWRSKIVTMVSSHEGFPMTLLEALQNGCVPILFSSFDSAYIIVQDESNGYLIKPFDEKRFAQRIIFLMKNEKTLLSMQQNALKSVTRFNIGDIANQWENLFYN